MHVFHSTGCRLLAITVPYHVDVEGGREWRGEVRQDKVKQYCAQIRFSFFTFIYSSKSGATDLKVGDEYLWDKWALKYPFTYLLAHVCH